MDVSSLLALLPEEVLDDLAAETRADHQVKKLKGALVFKLILFSMLNSQKLSLRIMEDFLLSATFRKFTHLNNFTTRHSTIRDRISAIEPSYFQKLFDHVFEKYNGILDEKDAVAKVDSTYVSLSAKLVDWAMENGTPGRSRQTKFSVVMKGSLPCRVAVYNEQKYISEDLALPGAIADMPAVKGSVVTFDRGLQSRKAFDMFTDKNILFVGRSVSPRPRLRQTGSAAVGEKPGTATVTVHTDRTGHLNSKGERWTESVFRLVDATIDASGKPICFVTNIMDMDAYEIAAIYKQRWEIEVFFKFLKQHLNLNHIVSRNENGVRVMVYMTMITAVLLLAYKKLNKIKGYKIAKHRFEIELDNIMVREIVIMCGGDPDKASHLWNST